MHPQDVAAIIIEPIQGEGGFCVAPNELMVHLRSLCDEHGIVLIADEIQSGIARTGALFAMEHYDVSADITVMAKGLAGGFPLAAMTGRADIIDASPMGGLGGTYGGSPIGLAAAQAVLAIIDEDDLCGRAQKLGETLCNVLKPLARKVPQLVDVRGKGMMVAAEFYAKAGDAPNPAFVASIRRHAQAKGLILLPCGVHGNIIRFLPPLTIEEELLREGLEIFCEAVTFAMEEENKHV